MIGGLKRAGVSVVCYLPDSLFKELYPALDADPDLRTVRVTNEGEGAAICGGVFLSGKRAALVMENSGLRAAAEPLARLGLGAGIPVIMLMSYRGELGENNWWAIPHGITMEPVLDALRTPYRVVREADEIERAITDAYDLVLRRLPPLGRRPRRGAGPVRRYDCMTALDGLLAGDELVIVSLGASVDEWYNAAPADARREPVPAAAGLRHRRRPWAWPSGCRTGGSSPSTPTAACCSTSASWPPWATSSRRTCSSWCGTTSATSRSAARPRTPPRAGSTWPPSPAARAWTTRAPRRTLEEFTEPGQGRPERQPPLRDRR